LQSHWGCQGQRIERRSEAGAVVTRRWHRATQTSGGEATRRGPGPFRGQRRSDSGRRLHQLECAGLPRVVSVQNAYSLLCRTLTSLWRRRATREKVALLPYSPLAMGLLSGKYHDAAGGCPDSEARLVKYRGRYAEAEGRCPIDDCRVSAAVRLYAATARKHGMSPAVMALAFVLRNPLVPSVVIGARDVQQLDELAQAVHVQLPQEMVDEIDQVHRMWPSPTP